MPEASIEAAVVAARRLFLSYKDENNGHLSNQVQLTAVRQAGWHPGDKKVGLIDSASRLTGLTISVSEFPPTPCAAQGDPSGDPIKALLVRKERAVKIYVSERENFCHKRFYVAKELCHLLIDDAGGSQYVHEAHDITRLLKDLLAEHTKEPDYPAYDSEMCAFWGACEMLLPPEFTDKALELLNRGSGDDLYQAALHFRIPKGLIEQRYLEDTVRDVFEGIHKMPDYQNVKLRPVSLGPFARHT